LTVVRGPVAIPLAVPLTGPPARRCWAAPFGPPTWSDLGRCRPGREGGRRTCA